MFLWLRLILIGQLDECLKYKTENTCCHFDTRDQVQLSIIDMRRNTGACEWGEWCGDPPPIKVKTLRLDELLQKKCDMTSRFIGALERIIICQVQRKAVDLPWPNSIPAAQVQNFKKFDSNLESFNIQGL